MKQQEQFEADYQAAFPDMGIAGLEFALQKRPNNRYNWQTTREAYTVWLKQAERHEAEIAELVKALREVCELKSNLYGSGSRTHIALSSFAEGARELLAKYEAKK